MLTVILRLPSARAATMWRAARARWWACRPRCSTGPARAGTCSPGERWAAVGGAARARQHRQVTAIEAHLTVARGRNLEELTMLDNFGFYVTPLIFGIASSPRPSASCEYERGVVFTSAVSRA